MTGITIFKSQ